MSNEKKKMWEKQELLTNYQPFRWPLSLLFRRNNEALFRVVAWCLVSPFTGGLSFLSHEKQWRILWLVGEQKLKQNAWTNGFPVFAPRVAAAIALQCWDVTRTHKMTRLLDGGWEENEKKGRKTHINWSWLVPQISWTQRIAATAVIDVSCCRFVENWEVVAEAQDHWGM